MKKILAIVLLGAILSLAACGSIPTAPADSDSPNTGAAYKAEGDGWYVDADGTLVVAEMTYKQVYSYSSPAPWYLYRAMITAIRVEDGISYISDFAFNSLEKVERVEFADSVTQIGDHAFGHCSSLKSITLPEQINLFGLEVFTGCTGLETVRWEACANVVKEKMFYNCSALKEVTLSEHVTTISSQSFELCAALETLTLPEGFQTFESDSFVGCDALTLRCAAGSKPEEQAIRYGIPYEVIG